MNILAVNVGSTSFKYKLYDWDRGVVLARGKVERIGSAASHSEHRLGTQLVVETIVARDHAVAIRHTLDLLQDHENGIIRSLRDLHGIGFKAVHAGPLTGPVRVTDEVLLQMGEFDRVAPAHNPPYAAAIRSFRDIAPDVPLVAVFETWFHASIPEYARIYAVPLKWDQHLGVRRYGFHGASFRYIVEAAPAALGMDRTDLKIVACHLGGSSSVCAMHAGVSLDTSMGFSPQSGLPMGNRCGDLDVFAVLHVMEKENLSIDEVRSCLTRQSGLYGISGLSADIRDLEEAAGAGNNRARLALDHYAYQVKKYVGAYVAALGGVDVLVFTGGVGENGAAMRRRICQGLNCLGLELDEEKNDRTIGQIGMISKAASPAKILVLPTDEEWIIARETRNLVGGAGQPVEGRPA